MCLRYDPYFFFSCIINLIENLGENLEDAASLLAKVKVLDSRPALQKLCFGGEIFIK